MTTIESFTGEYRFLSNFYSAPVLYEDIIYPTVEHAYQAAKTDNLADRRIISTMAVGNAKRYGQRITLRPDWDIIKVGIMEELLKKKFEHGYLEELLLGTGNATLIEGNSWHDNFWGACNCSRCADKKKLNTLGKLLMNLRLKIPA